MVRSAMAVFATDATAHAAGQPCQFRDEPSVLAPTVATRKASET
jgi:hypothetical protein